MGKEKEVKKKPRWIIATTVSILMSIMCLSFVPQNSWAIADAAVVAALYKIWDWAKGEMMDKMEKFQQGQTDQLMDKAEEIFKHKAGWEGWPASLQELFVENTTRLEDDQNKTTWQDASDYLDYSQGKGYGPDAAKYPAQTLKEFNKNYQIVQDFKASCRLTVPQPVGYTGNGCTKAQQQFTNYMITGMHPVPDYPATVTETADGQEYIQEKRSNETRMALAQLALNQSTSKDTSDFIDGIKKTLVTPTTDQINQESSAAVLRDTLIIDKARAMLELKQYEATLMNERLLATIVAQNEGTHLQHIHELTRNIH